MSAIAVAQVAVLLIAVSCVAAAPVLRPAGAAAVVSVPLARAYAHNDQDSAAVPLTDALNNGFCNIEADSYLINDTLYVGHDLPDLKGTLEEVYMIPLANLVAANSGGVGGGVYGAAAAKLALCETIAFLVDVKSAAQETYNALHDLLGRYQAAHPGLFRQYAYGEIAAEGAIEMMISGNRVSPEYLSVQPLRYVSYDGRVYEDVDVGGNEPVYDYRVVSWVSQNWNSVFLNRTTPFSDEICDEIRRIKSITRSRRQKLRFWNVPESEEFWHESIRCGVDILNVDNYAQLNEYLLA